MKVKTNQERWEVMEEHGVCEDYRKETAFGKEITLRLRADLEGDKGDYEVVYRFTDTWLTFQETNSRTYKTLKGARKWAAENGFELA